MALEFLPLLDYSAQYTAFFKTSVAAGRAGGTDPVRGSNVFSWMSPVVTTMITCTGWRQQRPSIGSGSRITQNDIPLFNANSVFFIYQVPGCSLMLNCKVLERDEAAADVVVADCDILFNNRLSRSILLAIKLMEQAEWDSSSGVGWTTNWGIIKGKKWRMVGGGTARKDLRRFLTVHLLSLCRRGT